MRTMKLREIHDFELALLDPCLAMTERGLRVNNERRLAMIENLDSQRGPLTTQLCDFVVQRVLPLHMDKLGDRIGLFRKRAVCKCCRNGKGKREACWACAGFAKKPTKRQEASLTAATGNGLGPCNVCGGAGESFRTEFNPASPEQVKIVLYDLLKLPKRTKDGKLTTDEEALKSLLADAAPEAREFIVALLRLGKLDTMRSIAVRIAPGPDGRIRTTYNPAGTETGRFSSSETFLIESTNLQNLPKREAVSADLDVKACIEADPGCVLIEADLSGAEAWVTAARAGDTVLLEHLRAGRDVHKWTAAGIFKKPEAEVTPEERQLGKTARHALNYGMQWSTFMRNVNAAADRTGVAINAAQAKQICAGYAALHPKLAQWHDEVLAKLVTKGTLETCFGRRRTFYGRNRGEKLGDAHREAIAYEPQSTIADLLNRGMLRWWRQHDGRVGELLAQVHDSVIVQTTEARGKMVAELVKRCLTEDITVNGITIRIPVDIKVLRTWAVHKEAA
jgi:DNA polymerase I-like protein with 3'-5' exonuclease and polymerase domains